MEGIKLSILKWHYSVYSLEENRIRSQSKAESEIVGLG